MRKNIIVSLCLTFFVFSGIVVYKFKTSDLHKLLGASTQRSIKEIFLSGGSQKCLLTTDNEEATVYFSEGKLRGDFVNKADGKTSISHIVISDSTSYSWKDGESIGFKSLMEGGDTGGAGQYFGVDLNKVSSYKCSVWNLDESNFVLPQDVVFTDFTETFKESPASDSGDQSQCRVCDSLKGDEKSQCKSVLNCN